MRNQEFHSFKVTRTDLPRETRGLQFHLPKEYLEQLTETNQRLERIEMLMEAIANPPARTIEVVSVPDNAKSKTPDEVSEVPFLSLNFINSPDFYKVSRTFLTDIEAGKKSFCFQRMSSEQNESFISIFASFISYSKENMPVLVIVDDFSRDEWKKIRGNFSIGMIQGCRCYDWGNVSLVEKKDILKISNGEYKKLFEAFKDEYKAIFWSVGPNGVHKDFAGFSYFALDSLDSVTLVIPKNKAKISEVVKAKSFYSDYKIPIKGLLNGE